MIVVKFPIAVADGFGSPIARLLQFTGLKILSATDLHEDVRTTELSMIRLLVPLKRNLSRSQFNDHGARTRYRRSKRSYRHPSATARHRYSQNPFGLLPRAPDDPHLSQQQKPLQRGQARHQKSQH